MLSSKRRSHRINRYQLTLRVDNDHAVILVDLRQSLSDDLVELTFVEVTVGHIKVTFIAGKAALWDVAEHIDKVVLRSNEADVTDGHWHRIEIIRYSLTIMNKRHEQNNKATKQQH